ISSWIGRTAASSTSTTRLDFSSPMPIAICDPYTLISTHTMITVNSPVSRLPSGLEGGSRPRTGSATPFAAAAAAPGHCSNSRFRPAGGGGGVGRRPAEPGAPDRTLFDDPPGAVDKTHARVARAQPGLGRRYVGLGPHGDLRARAPARLFYDPGRRGLV